MCRLAPARIVRIEGTCAWADVDGREISVACDAVDGLQAGDYVLCYAGVVVERLDSEEAAELLKVLAEIEELEQITS